MADLAAHQVPAQEKFDSKGLADDWSTTDVSTVLRMCSKVMPFGGRQRALTADTARGCRVAEGSGCVAVEL